MSTLTEELVDPSIAVLVNAASSLAIKTLNGASDLSDVDLERAIDEVVTPFAYGLARSPAEHKPNMIWPLLLLAVDNSGCLHLEKYLKRAIQGDSSYDEAESKSTFVEE
ncbi:hypothetical protein BGZ68_003690, partial [Mortierella alpina]